MVIPIYNEQAMLPLLRESITPWMDQIGPQVELILVNDGSRDHSLDLLMQWARDDARVRVLGLARNFGHQVAVTAGLDAATGDAIVIMDADLQDPPEVISRMIQRYCDGYDVVYGQRTRREGESLFKRISAWAFYRLMRLMIHRDLPVDAGDFRLISRRFLDALKTMRETHRYLRGMMTWVGFSQVAVEFERPPRAAGETKYTMLRMIKLAVHASMAFSPAPLRASFVAGAMLALGGFLYALYGAFRVIFHMQVQPGWASSIAVTCLVGGGILVAIGVLGEYVARIYEEVKGRPLYIVSASANLQAPAAIAEHVSRGQLPPGQSESFTGQVISVTDLIHQKSDDLILHSASGSGETDSTNKPAEPIGDQPRPVVQVFKLRSKSDSRSAK